MDAKAPLSSSPSGSYFKVFLRLRPSSAQSSISDSPFLTTTPDSNHIYVTPPAPLGFSKSRPVEKFTFARVFDESADQLDLFTETVLPLVQDAVLGKDSMLATLGVTGSGKSHTTLGTKELKGMTQMALEVVFRSLEGRMLDLDTVDLVSGDRTDAIVMSTPEFQDRMNSALDAYSYRRPQLVVNAPRLPDCSDITVTTESRSNYAVLISMYELYNDRIFDLLDETPLASPTGRRKALLFKKPSSASQWDASRDARKIVSGLRKISCSTLEEALTVLEYGQHNRKASPTNSNSFSSRSHAFFAIELKRFSVRHPGIERESSTLQIVDLAGSERARNTQTTGERLAEAGSINRSLMCLGQCLQLQSQSSMSTASASMIIRQSKLTELLFSNSLARGPSSSAGGASMIVTADARGDYNATSQILRYSALATEVTVPRRPATAASHRSVSAASVSSSSSIRTTGSLIRHPISTPNLAASSIISSNPSSTTSSHPTVPTLSKDKIIARLRAQLEETESQWRAAEDRCLTIEQTVREEMSLEMEHQIATIMQETREARWREEERREGFVDGKLEILMKGLETDDIVHLKPPAPTATTAAATVDEKTRLRCEELETENERLRMELMNLKRQLNNRSPSTTTGIMQDGGVRVPSNGRKISIKKRNRIVSGNRTEKGRPLMQIENGRLDEVDVLARFDKMGM